MAAGGKGDEPYLDIVVYKTRVFSEKADDLVRDLSVLMDLQESEVFRSELLKIASSKRPNIKKLERRKNKLLDHAVRNGLDLELLENEMRKRRQNNLQ